MRYIGILLVLASVPGFILLLQARPEMRRHAYFGIGLFPLVLSAVNLDAALISGSGFIGHTSGMVLSLLDTLCIGLLATSRKPFHKLPFVVPFLLYLFAVLLATTVARPVVPATFYLFQLLRMFLVFSTVATIIRERDALKLIAFGLALGALIQAVVSLWQRANGVFQVSGTMPHQNTLGMMLHFVTIPLLAMCLTGERSKLIFVGVGGGMICVALGASRGSIGFLFLGIFSLFLLSVIRCPTKRKFTVIGAAVGVSVLVSPIIYSGISQRFDALEKNTSDYDERAAFESAATMMATDHLLGVGPNQYVRASNVEGYADAAGVGWAHGSRSAHVHNLYLLMAAETGWFGMISFIIFLVIVIFRGFWYSFKEKLRQSGEVVLGFTIALIVMSLHSLYEWIAITYQVQAMVAIAMGVIAGFVRTAHHGLADGSFPKQIVHQSRKGLTLATAESTEFVLPNAQGRQNTSTSRNANRS